MLDINSNGLIIMPMDNPNRASEIRRTDITNECRKCPRHGVLMRLSIEDRAIERSPLHWWCNDCRGYWAEEYFYFITEHELPIIARTATFTYACPHCGSLDVSHACVVGCCDAHECHWCGGGFDLKPTLIQRRELPSPRQQHQRGVDRAYTTLAVGFATGPTLGVTIDSRRCPKHPDNLLSLAECAPGYISDECARFGWACSLCSYVYLDYVFNRTQRQLFLAGGYPEIACPSCGDFVFDSLGNRTVVCMACGSISKLHTEWYENGKLIRDDESALPPKFDA